MSTEQKLKPGSFLRHDSYRIERVLGQGGFGITYLATDLNLDRKVAIKEFFPKDYCDRNETTSHVTLGTQSASEFVNRLKVKFLKEARNIAKFDHPGIIKIHAAFEENNTAYYVMDYIEGESLSEMVKRNGPLSPERALRYVQKVGDALEYVHRHKINHLDIKPANIMVRRSDDNPILIDFGLSKQYDSAGNQTSTTPTGISHGYAPMEQYNDGGVREFSPQTDLYSLAATLYYILSGKVPPQAITLLEEPLTFPASIPQALRGPIAKAMSPVRRHRHESIRDFVDEISGKSYRDETRINVDVPSEDTVIGTPTPKPIPTPQPKPTPKPAPQPAADAKGFFSSAMKKLPLIVGAVAVLAVFFSVWRCNSGSKDASLTDSLAVDSLAVDSLAAVGLESFKDVPWFSPLGEATYSGTMIDTSAEDDSLVNFVPDGQGKAEIVSGNYKGNVYEGNFNQGVMEGNATYTLANGDVFEGTFTDNEYREGKYTVKATGEYFVGTFVNGVPDKGTWYDSNGQKL